MDMKLDVSLLRSPGERALPRDLLVRDSPPAHRPRERFAIRVRTADDVERLRALDLPLFLLRDEDVTMLGYPMRFPPILVAARTVEPALRSDLRVLTFASEEAARHPRLEDIVVAMLTFDPVAARALLERNRDLLDLRRLTKRVYQEDLEQVAASVRFHDALDIPATGDAPPRESIARLIRANSPRGVLP